MEKGKIPKELFEFSGSEREYRFINLNGEEETAILGKNDKLSHRKCPLDGANLVMVDDGVHTWDEHCYCCGGPYFSSSLDRDEYENLIIGSYSKSLDREIEKKKQELSKLEKLSSIAKNRDSKILEANKNNSLYTEQNNKPNLSAKTEPTDDPFYNSDPKFF